MAMEWVQKALDMIVGANLIPQDLSRTVTLRDGRPRPFLENAPQVDATNSVHEWDEQDLIGVGTGAASYLDGNAPASDAVAPVKNTNKTCNVGKTAIVTDNFVAALTKSGKLKLADGVLETEVQSALNYQKELKTREVLDECEWMHISGDKTITAGFPGGQTDGLEKFALANGAVLVPAEATNVAPVAFLEAHVKSITRNIAETFPAAFPDTVLTAPELKSDWNTFVGSGAGNPIVRVISTDKQTQDLIGGSPEVTKYDTGYGLVDVRMEPNLSPAYNPVKTGQVYQNVIFYNKALVKNAALRALRSEELARIGTSLQTMITTTFAQEQRLGRHTGVIRYVKSAIA